jgi:hypothetical protein
MRRFLKPAPQKYDFDIGLLPLLWRQSWDGFLVEVRSGNQTFSSGGHSGRCQRHSRVSGFVQSAAIPISSLML